MSATTAAPVEEQADAQPRTWARAQEIAWAARATCLVETPGKRYYRCIEKNNQTLYFDLVKLAASPNVERLADDWIATSKRQVAGRLYPDATDARTRQNKATSILGALKRLVADGLIEYRPHYSPGGKPIGFLFRLLEVPDLESRFPAGVAQSVRADDAEGWL